MISPDHIEQIQSTYPAPVAATFWQVAQHAGVGSDVFAKHMRLISLFEVILQYTCAIMLSYYRQRVDNLANVEDLLEKVRRPQLGHWQGLQQLLLKAYTQGGDNPLIAELCRSFTEPRKDSELVSAYRKLREWSESKPDNRKAISYSDVSTQMLTYRNWLTHGPGKLLGQSERAIHVPKVETLLTKMLLDLPCLVQYPLVYVREIIRHREHESAHLSVCLGTSQRWRPVADTVQGDLTAEHCYICRKTEEGTFLPLLDLHPFVICTHCKKEPGKEQAFILNEGGDEHKGSLSYISYECGHSFNIAEDNAPHLKDDMERLLNHDRWAEYLVQRALQRHGGYLQPIFRMVKQKENQASYAEEYRQLEKTLIEENIYSLPQPIVQRIFAQYEIHPPAEEPLKIETFTATPTEIEQGTATVLEWRTRGATRIVIEPEIGEVEAAGRQEISPSDSTTYTLHADNKANVSQARSVSITVTVPETPEPPMPEPPVIQWFTTRPERIERGTVAVLTWGTQGTVRAVLTPEVGEVAAIGQCEVRPADTVVYTLRASNTVGESQSQDVKVEVFVPAPPPPPGSLEEIWQTQLPEPIVKLLSSPQTDHSFAVGKDGAMFFLGKDGEQLWRTHAEAPLCAMTFTADGRRLVVADWNGSVRCYDEYSEDPLWKAQAPGPVSALETGRWHEQPGVFVGTWRQGLFFCDDTEGKLHTISETDFTISALSAFSNREGCITGDWEGGVTLYTAGGMRPRRLLLRQPVRALACLGATNQVLVLTARHSFYALDEQGEVFWLYESPAPVTSWAFASKASKCIYCTEGGQHYEICIAGSGQHRLVEERALRELAGERHDWLAVDAEADYLVARNRERALALYTGETLCQPVVVSSPVSGFYFDSYGFTLLVAAGNSVHTFRNQHKLTRSRPSKLKLALAPHDNFALGKSTIVEFQIANIGERPATKVRGHLKGRFAQPVSFEVGRILPGEVISRRCNVEPEIAGAFTVSAELHSLDGGEARIEHMDDVFTINVDR